MRNDEHDGFTTGLKSEALNVAFNGFAGATAGAVSRLLTAPFDVAKIRFQLDHGATRRYDSSLWVAMRSIYGEEGLIALWRGNLPAMLLWSAYTGVQFGVYEHLRSADFFGSRRKRPHDSSGGGGGGGSGSTAGVEPFFAEDSSGASGREGDNSRAREVEGKWVRGVRGEGGVEMDTKGERNLPPALANFAYGSIAAFIATVATYPLDITRTALAFQGVPKRYGSMSEFLSRTLRESGPRALFRGVTPTLAMITPQMGVSFAVWEALSRMPPPAIVTAVAPGSKPGGTTVAATAAAAAWQLGVGAAAGVAGKLAVFPLDTVKKRVQTATMLERDVAYGILPRYAGPMHALKMVLRQEGARALFRGSVPAVWKSGLSTAVTYAVYEWVRTGTAGALDDRRG